MSTPRTYWRTAGEQTTVVLAREPGTITNERAGSLQVRRRPPLRVSGALIAGGTHRHSARVAVLCGCVVAAAALAVALVARGLQERSIREPATDRGPGQVVHERIDQDVQPPTSSRSDPKRRQGARRTETGEKALPAPDTDASNRPPAHAPAQAAPPTPPAPAAPAPTESTTVEPTPSAPVPAEQSPASDFSFGARDGAAAP